MNLSFQAAGGVLGNFILLAKLGHRSSDRLSSYCHLPTATISHLRPATCKLPELPCHVQLKVTTSRPHRKTSRRFTEFGSCRQSSVPCLHSLPCADMGSGPIWFAFQPALSNLAASSHMCFCEAQSHASAPHLQWAKYVKTRRALLTGMVKAL